MRDRFNAVRDRLDPRRSAKLTSHDAQMECLRRIRSELTRTYPEVEPANLFQILKECKLNEFPEALLMTGRVKDKTSSGAEAMLSQASSGDAARRTDWHPLFSSDFYDAVNPDVAAAGLSPWLHYQVHGRTEGRSPHPLIDAAYLAASVAGVPRSDVIDEYLISPELWVFDTGPYVDCKKFMLFGDWDGTSNPLTQIVLHQIGSHWVHRRLMIVDSAAPESNRARLIGSSVLLTRNEPGSRFAALHSWRRSDDPAPARTLTPAHTPQPADPAPGSDAEAPGQVDVDPGPEYTVVPGFFLGAAGREIASSGDFRLTPDMSVIQLPTEFMSVTAGRLLSTENLVHITGWLTHKQLTALVAAAKHPTAMAPHSPAQAAALELIATSNPDSPVTVLPHGEQVRITAANLRVENGSPIEPEAPEWTWPWDVDPKDLVIVLSEAHHRRANNDERVHAALSGGAALAILGASDIEAWLPVIAARRVVVVDRVLVELVHTFVDDQSLYRLPGGEVGNQS